ncbi:MAG: hypothetical protein QMD36_06660 [Candidatus Aenigmarchaeota archaeon]|nr:hypothetical protein [Candidatus Aenigmarchaeota archaeon]
MRNAIILFLFGILVLLFLSVGTMAADWEMEGGGGGDTTTTTAAPTTTVAPTTTTVPSCTSDADCWPTGYGCEGPEYCAYNSICVDGQCTKYCECFIACGAQCQSDTDCPSGYYCDPPTCACKEKPPELTTTTTAPPPETTTTTIAPYCGDGSCNGAETYSSCPQDCCQSDCTATYDSICHSQCNGYNGCSYQCTVHTDCPAGMWCTSGCACVSDTTLNVTFKDGEGMTFTWIMTSSIKVQERREDRAVIKISLITRYQQ